ncbi:uncharacterized protein LOC134189677 [Corticium candelabrum]|uniref:uncharacterized protein LOC134189677 n=1 Tax=Corticium candelabrum TaxID=121492 RepID=UPI002E2597F4|nr:uncharacterized protein LOC134189677 [Corticium candelabrum]
MGDAQTFARNTGRKLYQIVYALHGFGIGRKVTRTIWKKSPDDNVASFWTITKIRPYRDLRRIRAWGILTWQGVPNPQEKKIRRCLKRQWILLERDFMVKTNDKIECKQTESEV